MRWTKAALVLTVVMPVLDSLSTFGGITKQSSHSPIHHSYNNIIFFYKLLRQHVMYDGVIFYLLSPIVCLSLCLSVCL